MYAPADTPALERARAALAEHSEKPNRLIAKEIGGIEMTVRRTRKHVAVDAADADRLDDD